MNNIMEISVKDMGKQNMKMFTDKNGKPVGYIYNVQYPLIASEDCEFMHTIFKKGVVTQVSGLIVEKILQMSNGKVKVYTPDDEVTKRLKELEQKLEDKNTEVKEQKPKK